MTSSWQIIERNLQARGHISRHAGSVERALAQLMAEWPDAMIVDVSLPDQSGWELVRSLREDQRQALRVIMVSSAPISRRDLRELGLQNALQKPFAIGSLMSMVEACRSPGRTA